MSIPWGETKGDHDIGGYHLVWARDLVQCSTALLASGQTGTPARALIWLAATQGKDGSFPQNSWIDGTAYWPGFQLDEIATPILLAWRLRRKGGQLGLFNAGPMTFRAASYLISHGPVTAQERWEENSGYSPSTLAAVIASLVCAADFAIDAGERDTAEFLLVYADWLSAHLEEWTVTTCGELVDGYPRHFIRLNPSDAKEPDPHPDPNTGMLAIANAEGIYPARNVVGGDFLQLVRLGVRAAHDSVVMDSVVVMDRIVKRDLPEGPCWRRYNHDGYGQKDAGGAFDGTGVGRSWPILTGERGHYELAAGNDPMAYITAMERFANAGGMLTEQLWDSDDVPSAGMKRGLPTGAAMPLCWSHAEYIELVRSRHDGVCFDRIDPAFERYVVAKARSRHEIWTARHATRRMYRGKILRIILTAEADVVWSPDGWATTRTAATTENKTLHLWYCDLPTQDLAEGGVATFTLFWKKEQRWEERNYTLTVVPEPRET
jgi:glucoamylase